MIAALSKSRKKLEKAIYALETTHMDSGATTYMKIDDAVLSVIKKLSCSSIETASGEVVREKSDGTSKLHPSRRTGPVKPDCVLHVSKIAYNLVSVTGVCED